MRSLPQGLKGCFLPGTAKALMASPAAQALHKVLQLPKGSLGCETQQGLAQATSRSEPFHPPTTSPRNPNELSEGEEGFLEGEEVWFRRWALGNDTDSNINKRAKIYYVLTKRQGSY